MEEKKGGRGIGDGIYYYLHNKCVATALEYFTRQGFTGGLPTHPTLHSLPGLVTGYGYGRLSLPIELSNRSNECSWPTIWGQSFQGCKRGFLTSPLPRLIQMDSALSTGTSQSTGTESEIGFRIRFLGIFSGDSI